MMFARNALLPEGWRRDVRLVAEGGRFTAVLPDAAPEPGDEMVDFAVPGLPNLHSHAFQRAMAGLTERRGAGEDGFWTWRTIMYRQALAMTPDDVEAVAAQLYAELLEAGFTRVGEFHYLHHDTDGHPYADPGEMAGRIAAAAAATGLGLTLLPVFYAHAGFGGRPPEAAQRRFISDLDGFARLLDRAERLTATLDGAIVGVAPHSLRAVTPEELGHLTALRPQAPLHIHIAEQTREVEDSLANLGQRPVAWLLDHAAVNDRWCLVHATHLTDGETVALAASGAVAGLCPITEANLGDGIFPADAFLGRGGRFGVGSNSNVSIDAAGELRQLEYSQRLALRRRNVVATPHGSTGQRLHALAVDGGARALGVTGGLRAGARANVVSLKPRFDDGTGAETILDGWVFAGSASIDAVWAGGRQRVRDGRHVEREAIRRRFEAAVRRLR